MDIGPVVIKGRFTKAKVLVAGRPLSMPVHWFPRDVAPDADGVISPGLLPFESVSLAYGPAERPVRLLRFNAEFDEETGIHVPIRLGKHRLAFRFAPAADTVATTAAAAVLAQSQGAGWTGATRRVPIAMGVDRPVRPLMLLAPLPIGELRLDRLLARVADFAGTHELPADPDDVLKADEILVVARRSTQPPVYRVTLGRPALDGCFAASYRPKSRQLVLACSDTVEKAGGDPG